MPQDGRLLEGFVEFLERAGAERITTELALAWARLPVRRAPVTVGASGSSVVRGFARHLATIDPASEVPSRTCCPGTGRGSRPTSTPMQEIAALMAAAGRLTPPLRAARHQTLIGLLAVTGDAPGGGARARPRTTSTCDHGVVHVRAGKQNKQREVPLHDSTVSALRDYARLRDARFPTAVHAGVLHLRPGTADGPRRSSTRRSPSWSARSAWTAAAPAPGPGPHDLRHAFAVRTLLDWYQAGEDIDRRMPLLSTYLGHVDPASTYWYLEAVPELLAADQPSAWSSCPRCSS